MKATPEIFRLFVVGADDARRQRYADRLHALLPHLRILEAETLAQAMPGVPRAFERTLSAPSILLDSPPTLPGDGIVMPLLYVPAGPLQEMPAGVFDVLPEGDGAAEWEGMLNASIHRLIAYFRLYERLQKERQGRLAQEARLQKYLLAAGRNAGASAPASPADGADLAEAAQERLRKAAHDLRSPLNAVIGYGDLLREDLEDKGLDDLAADAFKIRRVGKRLLKTIDALVEPLVDDGTETDADALSGHLATPEAPRAAPLRPSTSADAPAAGATPRTATSKPAVPDLEVDFEAEEEDRVTNVLVVDDDDELRGLMARFLEGEGFTAHVARNGREGIASAREIHPDAITLDVHMPEMDGWSVLDALKSDDELASIPVIMLTGRGNERMAARALRTGVDDYLIKGDMTALGLRRAVEGVLEKDRLRRQVDRTQRALVSANEALRGFADTLEQRVDEQTLQLRGLASSLTLAEQRERQRISQVLHDNLQQVLYGINLRVHLFKQKTTKHTPDWDEAAQLEELGEMGDLLQKAIHMTRTLTVELSPPALRKEGLGEVMEWLAAQMHNLHNLKVDVETRGSCRVPLREMRVLLFQLVRELLFNVAKHADVERAKVILEEVGDDLRIRVEDDGQGFDVAAMKARASTRTEGGLGLSGMEERLSLFRGHLDIQSAPGEGTRTLIEVPCEALGGSPETPATQTATVA